MKLRKLVSTAMVSALALGMSTVAFAADTETINTLTGGATGSEVVGEASVTIPTIDVVMPTTHGFAINPYKMDDKEQIASTTAQIQNNSDVDIDVQLKSATTTLVSDTTAKPALVTSEAALTKATNKSIFLNLVASTDENFGEDTTKTVNLTGKNTVVTQLGTVAKTDGVLYLKYDGKVVANPVTGWDATDKVTVTSVYTFTVNTPAE